MHVDEDEFEHHCEDDAQNDVEEDDEVRIILCVFVPQIESKCDEMSRSLIFILTQLIA